MKNLVKFLVGIISTAFAILIVSIIGLIVNTVYSYALSVDSMYVSAINDVGSTIPCYFGLIYMYCLIAIATVISLACIAYTYIIFIDTGDFVIKKIKRYFNN